MVRILPNRKHAIDDPKALAKFATKLFSTRRKQLRNILGRTWEDWPRGVTAEMRPETLTVGQALALWRMDAS